MSSSATTFDYVITALYSLGYVLMQILYYASQVLVGLWRVISLIIVKPITTVLYILALPALYFGGWVGSLIGYISDFLKGFEVCPETFLPSLWYRSALRCPSDCSGLMAGCNERSTETDHKYRHSGHSWAQPR